MSFNDKPHLVDSITKKRVQHTLHPQRDYWKPVKSGFSTFYYDWIIPNKWAILLMVGIIILLIYRYRTVQERRLLQEYETQKKKQAITEKRMQEYYEQFNTQIPEINVDQFEKKIETPAYPVYPINGKGELKKKKKK
jgi:hypothetical protein